MRCLLIKIAHSDNKVIEFGYDGIGRRAWRKEDNILRSFFYDGDRIIAEREGNSWVIRHLLGLMPIGFIAGGSVRVYHSDRLGSIRWVTDASQSILVSYTYEGFGKIIAQNGGGGGPYQFCGLWGYRNDWDASLLHVGARYYEPEVGRFVQRDFYDSNWYAYCDNDPVNFVDPLGTQRKKPKPKPKPQERVLEIWMDEDLFIYIDPPPKRPPKPPPVRDPDKIPELFIIDYDKGKPADQVIITPMPPPGGRVGYYDDEDKLWVIIDIIPKPKPRPKPPPILT